MVLYFKVYLPRSANVKHTRSNYISTTRYNIATFLPFALLLQFKRYANVYFLTCAIMQSIPLISPLSPFSAIAPLIFVLSLSMARYAYEDYKRWKSDQNDNAQQTNSFQLNAFKQVPWKLLRSGDLVRVAKDEILPVDMLILLCSSPSGVAYVETSSLDGEKNLKPKCSISRVQLKHNLTHYMPNFRHVRANAQCSNPSTDIDDFDCTIDLYIYEESIKERLNRKNMLLRGCKLKNTDWVIGLAVYVGEDTAIMMNGSKPFTKISNIESKVNYIILIVLVCYILCSAMSALYCYFCCLDSLAFYSLLLQSSSVNCAQVAGIALGSYFILYSTFIPISLIVSLYFVKVFQGYFMAKDKEMYCVANYRSMECHTVSINEYLGQIEYILTDKTGTLTCNKMYFRNVVIGNYMYGYYLSLQQISYSFDYSQLSQRPSAVNTSREERFDSRGLSYELIKPSKHSSNHRFIELMFLIITTCHYCVVAEGGQYEGASPDEIALLKAAKKVGFKFVANQNQIITVSYNGKDYVYEMLKLVEFDSNRKRMTMVLRRNDRGIVVYMKGADSALYPLLSSNQPYLNNIKYKTNEMTRIGLRSLWFAYKTYPSNTDISTLSITYIYSKLMLIGATGIEDKLQDFVPYTIHALRLGNIKFIMLTGDKLETAENIAMSCRLVDSSKLIRNNEEVNVFAREIDYLLVQKREILMSPIIDGSTVVFAYCEEELLTLIEHAKSAVFCRVTPGQKAYIVRLVKKLNKLTLAIGDGANDVNMIMYAHVGVGIFGYYGTRAAQVSNYAIGYFCLLWKLLLYYGRLNYIRITEMILYFFYKNMVFTIVQFVYSFYNLGSGQSFWLSWSITFYNMIFTFFPVVLRAVFEVDLQVQPNKKTFKELSYGTHSKQTLYSYYPNMYIVSQQNQLFTKVIFFSWFTLGVLQGTFCLLIMLYSMADAHYTSGTNSYCTGFYFAEISAYTSVIIVVTVKLAINVKQWNLVLLIGFLVPSIGAYLLFLFAGNILQSYITFGDTSDLLYMPSFYTAQMICVGGMFAIDMFLFSLYATKLNFENYFKFKSLKEERLSETNLDMFMVELKSKVAE